MNWQMASYKIQIKEFHLDTFGHVNNATYLQIMEEARWEMITQRGYGLEVVQSLGQGPVILEIQLKFMKELRLRENVEIRSQVLSYDKKIGRLLQQFFSDGEQELARAEMVFGLFDTKERKLILPTQKWLFAIGASA